jgi:hypothetical protein
VLLVVVLSYCRINLLKAYEKRAKKLDKAEGVMRASIEKGWIDAFLEKAMPALRSVGIPGFGEDPEPAAIVWQYPKG